MPVSVDILFRFLVEICFTFKTTLDIYLQHHTYSFGLYNPVIFVWQWCHWREKASYLQIFSFEVDHGECILLMMFIKAVPCSCCSLKFRPQADQSSVGCIWTRAVQIYQVHKEEIRVWVEDQKEWWRTTCSRVLKKKRTIVININFYI